MSTDTGVRYAAIDLGSNSTKITVAHVVDDTMEIIANESTMTRIGESVNETGDITLAKQEAVISTMQKYQQLAQKLEASSITVVATEAVRKARNHEAFLDAIQRETGLDVHIVSGETEAILTYLGATSGNHQTGSDVGVTDIGGGSTELIIAQQGHIQWLTSLPIGSGWLHDHYLASNPPIPDETDQAHIMLDTYLHQFQLPQEPAMLIATGSSAKSLLALAKQALQIDKEDRLHPRSQTDQEEASDSHTQTDEENRRDNASRLPSLTRYDLLGCLGLLSALPAEEIARRYDQQLERARVLPGGALIMLTLMDTLQLAEIFISERGVSEGALQAALRYGENWVEHPDLKVDPDHIGKAPDPSHLDESDEPSADHSDRGGTSDLPFAEVGKRELRSRSKKFINWIGPVLKNEDVEAVHQMRVASRRLRATLDGYESACARKPFKSIYQEVKQAADLLGTARDTDVMLQHLEQHQQQVPDDEKPGIEWLVSRLQSYRQRQQREIAAFFEDFRSKRFTRLAASCIANGGSNRGKG